MNPSVTIVSIADIPMRQAGIGREGAMTVKPFPLETGVPGVEMEFAWTSYAAGYGTPRHKHTFDQFRFALEGNREIKDGFLKTGECGFYPEGVSYGPQLQTAPSTGLGLQFQGAAGLPYLRHLDLRRAQKELEAEGGVFEGGIYRRTLPDGTKIVKDSHAACAEHLMGHKTEFPKPRFDKPIVMHSENGQWTPDRKLRGVEHKHLGAYGVRRSGARFTRLQPSAVIPSRTEEDAEIRYLVEGSVTYEGKTLIGGTSEAAGTYMWIQAGADVGEIGTASGGTFFVIELPMLADIIAERARAHSGQREAELV